MFYLLKREMMDTQRLQESPFANAVRPAYRSIRAVYRRARVLKNHILNLIDPPIIILVYHRVTRLPSDPEMLAVAPENFHQHMKFLKQHCRILRFEEDWADLKERAVVITFDDGYADNAREALPILEELEVPATFFVSTGQIGTGKEFWWHQLECILLGYGELPPHFKLEDALYGRVWDVASSEQRKVLYTSLNRLMQKVDVDRREAWLEQLRTWAGSCDVRAGLHRSMTKDELKRLAVSPWTTIGAHSVTHSALSALTENQQRKEILSSKQDLENIIGTQITTFSYPFGRKIDYDWTSVRLCREVGFVKAASNFPGQVHRWTDSFQLPRHLVRDWDLETFVSEVRSFWVR